MIKNQTYNLKHVLLTNELLDAYINNFWNDVFSSIGSDKHLLLMCKVQYSEAELGYRTLGHLRKVNIEDKELFIEYLTERLGIFNDAYVTLAISKFTFSYVIKEGLAAGNRRLLQDLSDKSVTTHRFNNLNLPISMNPSEYGEVKGTTPFDNFTRHFVHNNKVYEIDVSLTKLINNVTILGASDLKWKDTKLIEGFKREIGKSTLYFLDGELVVRKYQVPAKPFTQLKVDPNMVSNFVTMDLETITQDGKLTPYLVCAYNGKDYITSYANESLDQKVLFTSFIEQLLTFFGKSNNLLVYAHNLSGFDGIFLMKHLLSFGKVEPLLFNGRLMSIKIKLNNKLAGGKYYGKVIIFKDSYLLLPLSLRKLCKAFNVVTSKGFFPFLMNTINYIGELPQFKYWKGVSDLEYNGLLSDYTNKLWSFKDEAIKYCKLDCKCLYDVLTKFNILIFKEFKVNMTKSLTLPALAMRIFKTHFMPKDSIYQILGSVEQDIRNSYTGGAVDFNKSEDLFHGSDTSVAIASAITAGARIHMSIFKNNPDFNLYYTDTDSVVIDQELPESMIGQNLGQLKLEHTIDRAVFLAPKVYGLVTAEGVEVIKIKGLSKNIKLNINDLEQLLVKDSSKEFNQEKWYKSIVNSEINVSNQIYTLSVTSNKRQIIYINDIFERTIHSRI